MAEEDRVALVAPLWVGDVRIARFVDEHEQRFVELEVFVQDLPMRTLTAVVLPEGNPLVLQLSESLARDVRKGLERSDAPETQTPSPVDDAVSRTREPSVTPVPASGYGSAGELLGFQGCFLDIRGATIEGYIDQNGERFLQFEALVRDLPTKASVALLLPEGNPLILHLAESLDREWWNVLVDTEWWGEPAELC